MLELSLNRIKKFMGTNHILEDVNIHVYENDRVGIIGPNGSGKSTILKLIAGIVKLKLFPGSWSPGYDYGWISLPKEARVAYLDQMPSYEGHMTVMDVLQLAFEEAYKQEKKMRQLELKMAEVQGQALDRVMKDYDRASELFMVHGGYEIEEKTSKIISGLGFSQDFLGRTYDSLSGGEKTTVALGKLLMHNPDILLLDEPTNHLDYKAIDWLEAYLKTYKGIVMIVSHDRYFLDAVTNKTIEIEHKTTRTYNGNYTKFLYLKQEAMRVQYDQYREQQKVMDGMKKQIQELREWAMKADNNKFFKRAASIQIKLDKMVKIAKPVFNKPNMRLTFLDQSRSGKEVVLASDLSKGYGTQDIFSKVNLQVRYGDRIGLLGPNGCGKSTLIKMILGQVKPDSGNLRLGESSQVAYLPQDIKFLNEDLSVVDCFRENIVIEEGKAREYLAKYMFFGKRVFTEVRGLSGGERIRLKLALLLYQPVNFLILDEPTNHLDIESIETLEEALENFKGTLLFVSHDRYFTNRLARRVVHIEGGKILSLDGNYDTYKDLVLSKPKPVADIVSPKKKVVQTKVDHEEKSIEASIVALEEAIHMIDLQMEGQGLDYEVVASLYSEKAGLESRLETLWETYEGLEGLR